MKVLGITGGMGSGKTTVASYLKDKGAVVVDADIVAREVLTKGSEAISEIEKTFGKEVLLEDGSLNRNKLAEIVFKDGLKLNVLNSITHKYIIEKLISEVDAIKKAGKTRFIVIDAPIPVKHGFVDMTDEIWAVVADKEKRVERIIERSGLSHEEALARIESQANDDEYINVASKVIENNKDLYDLKIKVSEMLQDISK